jgi:hypothetical protein
MFLGTVLLLALLPAIETVQDPDFWWHIGVGDWILTHHQIPHIDLFTYTVSTHEFIAHEWLSETIIAILFRNLGMGAVALFFGAVTWLGFFFILKTMKKQSFPFIGIALLIGLLAGNPIWGPRPQMITFAGAAFVLYALKHYRDYGQKKILYPLPFIFIIWANCHAGFVIGLGFLVLFLMVEVFERKFLKTPKTFAIKPLVVITVLSFMAIAINPNFLEIYLYPIKTLGNSALQNLVDEWKSPNFHDHAFLAYEAMILLIITLLVGAKGKLKLFEAALLLITLDLSLHAVRNIVLFVVVAIPSLAFLLETNWNQYIAPHWNPKPPPKTVLTGSINLAVLFLIAIIITPFILPALVQSPTGKITNANFPVQAINSLHGTPPPGRVFNQFQWGGYMTYRLPQTKIYIYGETTLLGNDFLNEYEAVVTLKPNYEKILSDRQITWIIYATGAPLEVALETNPEWHITHKDKQATILVRQTVQTNNYLSNFP